MLGHRQKSLRKNVPHLNSATGTQAKILTGSRTQRPSPSTAGYNAWDMFCRPKPDFPNAFGKAAAWTKTTQNRDSQSPFEDSTMGGGWAAALSQDMFLNFVAVCHGLLLMT